MIHLIKDIKYFKAKKELHSQCFYISAVDRHNISIHDLTNIFTSNLYKNYFFEYPPLLYFFSDFKFQDDDEIFLLIENICHIPINLRIKSNIIMEKNMQLDIYNLPTEMDKKTVGQLILEILKLECHNENFIHIIKYLKIAFFTNDSKIAVSLLHMICTKYNITFLK